MPKQIRNNVPKASKAEYLRTVYLNQPTQDIIRNGKDNGYTLTTTDVYDARGLQRKELKAQGLPSDPLPQMTTQEIRGGKGVVSSSQAKHGGAPKVVQQQLLGSQGDILTALLKAMSSQRGSLKSVRLQPNGEIVVDWNGR